MRVAPFAFLFAAAACASQAPAPVPPPQPSPSQAAARVDAVARACAKIASCAHAHDAARVHDPSACVDFWIGRMKDVDAYAACVARAKSCADVDGCLRERGGNAVAAAYCRAHPGEQTACDGAKLVTCAEDDPAESTVTDCAALGAACGETHAAGGLITRGCMSPSRCPAGAPEARCDSDGNAIVSCHDGAIERTPCARGVPCEERRGSDGAVSVQCEPPGHVHCTDAGKSWCDGARLFTCSAHGHTGEMKIVDCAAVGMACDASLPHAACAVPGVRSCSPAAARCDGSSLSFCAAGRSVKIACDSIGFGRCDPDGHGLEAACAPNASP
jgi:hypothetical protein